jgi:hypothetical protein
MTCSFAGFLLWTLRGWFASDRSLRALAPLELAWTERGLACAWPRLAMFLSIVDCERVRELDVAPPSAAPAAGLTHDEAAVLAALACARWSADDTARCLAGFLDADSAAAAARAAVRVREPRVERATALDAWVRVVSPPRATGADVRARRARAPHP